VHRTRRYLLVEWQQTGVAVSLIGGADVATELDAKRAIDQGVRAATALFGEKMVECSLFFKPIFSYCVTILPTMPVTT